MIITIKTDLENNTYSLCESIHVSNVHVSITQEKVIEKTFVSHPLMSKIYCMASTKSCTYISLCMSY